MGTRTSAITTNRRSARGFTLIEIVIVGAIMGMLWAITTQSFFGGIRSATLDVAGESVVRDMNLQQAKAMHGVSSNGAAVDYSIRFETDRYVLYPGSVYDAGNVQNRIVNLEPAHIFSEIAVPDQTLTYARGNGIVRDFASGADHITLSDPESGESVVISINAYGVVTLRWQ